MHSQKQNEPGSGGLPVLTLAQWGWKPFYQQQLSLDDYEKLVPVRVLAVHRGHLDVAHDAAYGEAILPPAMQQAAVDERPTVGDWLLIDASTRRVERVLERQSLFRRMAPGAKQQQLIAANVDSVFIVSSCNDDFNLSRLERYLALAAESGCVAQVVLTKSDMCVDPAAYMDAVRAITDVPVVAIDGRSPESIASLESWLLPGETIALLGSSGVGKSTLLNTLCGQIIADTAGIREDDAKGRHTTRHRSLHPLPGGALLLDSPGMRELGLVDVGSGLAAAFDDINRLAAGCRFADCQHQVEPGCAVRKAMQEGEIDERRLNNWQKLQREQEHHDRTLAERRASDKAFGKHCPEVMKQARLRRR